MDPLDEPPSPDSRSVYAWSLPVLLAAALSGTFDVGAAALEVTLIVIGLILSGIYSGSEVAFFSLARTPNLLEPDQTKGGVDGKTLKMLGEPRRLLATILISNTLANVVVSVLAASLTGRFVALFGVPEVVLFTVEVIVVSFMILILSEVAPKVVAIHNPLKTSRRLSGFIYAHYVMLNPLTFLVSRSTRTLEEWLPRPTTRMTTDDLLAMAEASEREGSLKEDEREIIENVIEFATITVREIMTSRVNIVAVSVDQTLHDVLELIRAKGLSRLPLYENDLDNILGVIYSKDVLPFLQTDEEGVSVNWKTIARKPLFIPSSKKLDALLQEFQSEKTHMAIVVDEYGGTEGVVTMDDLLEEIVGDMVDESGEHEEKLFTEIKGGGWLCDARIDLDEVGDLLELELTHDDDEFETLGGLMYHLTERIPGVGEKASYKGMEVTVHSVRNGRIHKLRVRRLSQAGTGRQTA